MNKKISKIFGLATAIGMSIFLNSHNPVINSMATTSTHLEGFWQDGLKKDPNFNENSGIVSYEDKIYIIGGYGLDENGYNNEMNRLSIYDTKTDEWSSGAPNKFYNGIALCQNGFIYIMASTSDPTLKKYSIEEDKWYDCGSMPVNLLYSTAQIINDKIYCIGGLYFDENYNFTINADVFIYDISASTWSRKSSTLPMCLNSKSIAVKDKIYCFGMMNEDFEGVNTVLIYDTSTNTYTFGESMPTIRGNICLSVIGEEIYTFGGMGNIEEDSYKIEVYNIRTNTWRSVKDSLINMEASLMATVDNEAYLFDVTGTYKYRLLTDLEHDATINVTRAEENKTIEDLERARDSVNKLPESSFKKELEDKLNNIIIDNLELELKKSSSNIDIYIKSKNALIMTLSTNSITFEDFGGTEDVLIDDAVEISINSSLPYNLNAYLVTEIQNSDKSNTMNKEILQLKDDSEVNYQYFNNIDEKMTLKNNCEAGNDKEHLIDFKLEGGIAHEKDIYKTVIKFEVEQV